MLAIEQREQIDSPIDQVWRYVSDIRHWAASVPGCKTCELIDDRHSRWTIKVGAGALVRTVVVDVHIDQWDGPGRVSFNFKLANDPVEGAGSYQATAMDNGSTDICISMSIIGAGPMAPVWETVSRPLLPILARSLMRALKQDIELAPPDASSDQTSGSG